MTQGTRLSIRIRLNQARLVCILALIALNVLNVFMLNERIPTRLTARWAAVCIYGAIVFTVVDWIVLRNSLILLFRNFRNERSRLLVHEVLGPISRASGYWVTLADDDLSLGNTGYDVAPAIAIFLYSTGVVLAGLEHLGFQDRSGLPSVGVGVICAWLGVRVFRRARDLRVQSQQDLGRVVDRLERLVASREPSVFIPFFATVRVDIDLWKLTVETFLSKCDLAVMIYDDLYDSTALNWELRQATRAARAVVVLRITEAQEVVVETHRAGETPVRSAPCHITDTPTLVRRTSAAVLPYLFKKRDLPWTRLDVRNTATGALRYCLAALLLGPLSLWFAAVGTARGWESWKRTTNSNNFPYNWLGLLAAAVGGLVGLTWLAGIGGLLIARW